MIFHNTWIQGLTLIELTPFKDARGEFARLFCENEFKEYNLDTSFVQINKSINYEKGTLRGLHYQVPPFAETKVVTCLQGSMFDVVVDLRKNSTSFLKSYSVELSANNNKMLYIPKGFAHGFQILEENTIVMYFHSNFYSPDSERGIMFNDKLIDISWPLAPTRISKKDKTYSPLTNQFKGIEL